MEGDANELVGMLCGGDLKFHLKEPQRSDGQVEYPGVASVFKSYNQCCGLVLGAFALKQVCRF